MSNEVQSIGKVFMTIPIGYEEVYQKLMLLFSEYGIDAIKDCNVSCNKKQSHIIDCFNIFCSACAAHAIGRTKESSIIMNYLKGQMDIYYPNFVLTNGITFYLAPLFEGFDISNIQSSSIADYKYTGKVLTGSYQVTCDKDSCLFIFVKDKLNTIPIITTSDGSKAPLVDVVEDGFVDGEHYYVYRCLQLNNGTNIITF